MMPGKRAFNVATKQGGRPLRRIRPMDLETFITKRSTYPALAEAGAKPTSRRSD